jgi:hypothetical protein
VGSPIKLFLDKLYVQGLVVAIDGIGDTRERQQLKVDIWLKKENSTYTGTSGEDAYLADFLKIGDEITDSEGRAVVKIVNKKVEDAKQSVPTSDGRIVLQRNPLKKDIYLTLDIDALKIDNKYYLFDDIPILVGHILPLNFKFITISPEITSVELPQ